MAGPNDVRESFPTTEPVGGGAGITKTSATEGQASAGILADVAFGFKDANGNVVLPQLTSRGQIPVAIDGQSGQRSRSHGRVPGVVLTVPGSGDYTGFQTVLAINAVAASGYGDMSGRVACRRGAIFELVYQDASSSVILDAVIVDAGQYTSPIALGPSEDTFTVPASAITPQFLIRGGNFQQQSDLHATLAVTAF